MRGGYVRRWWRRRQLVKRWGTADLAQIRVMRQRMWEQQVHEAAGRWAKSVADVSNDEWRAAMTRTTKREG